MQKKTFRYALFALAILFVVGIRLTIANERAPLFSEVVGRSAETASTERIMRSRLVSADLTQLTTRSTLQINLFDDTTFTAVATNIDNSQTGQLLWLGTVERVADSDVVFTMRNGVLAGLIDIGTERYRLRWFEEGDIYRVEQLDLTWQWREAEPISINLPPTTPPVNRANSDDGTVIDILIAYTDGARQFYGSTAATLAELDLAIAETNTAYQNSQINTQLRLVHTVEVDYSASSSMSNDLGHIQKPADGVMDELHTLRDTYNADLVHLIVEEADSGLCGIAYLMSTLSAGFEAWAFGVTRADCTTGRYVLAHEVGHNMGSEHDPANAQNDPLYNYSYGHWEPGYNWRTLMAYNCPSSCPVVGYFSDPNVSYQGAPTGVANSQDNARSIRSVLSTMANFRVSDDTPPDPSGTVVARVLSSADDVEERLDTGHINTSSSDLELIDDSSLRGLQTVGIRFQNIKLPQGATITNAYLQFTTDEADSGTSQLTIYGEDVDNAAAFTTSAYNVSTRSKTSASADWAPSAWNSVGQTHQSTNLAAVVQEIVNRSGWQSSNSMAFVITGSGERTAESFDGSSGNAPLLVIEYESDPTPTPSGTPPTATPTPDSGDAINFALIGDFGTDDSNEAAVATLVASWNPEFIATVGDNVYGSHTFDETVGKYYCDFVTDVSPDDSPIACDGGNSPVNRFFPATGNHDYDDGPTDDFADYLSYFTLPGANVPTSGTSSSELYYDVRQGAVHLFIIDSESISNAGGTNSAPYNEHRAWLQAQLAASTAQWKLVIAHHPPYSSARHGSNSWMQWPYAAWGADAVIAGHDHTYERIVRDGIVYFVNGMGGRGFYDFETVVTGSAVRYNSQHGAMRGAATENGLLLEFINVSGDVIDSYQVGDAPPTPTPTPTLPAPSSDVIDVRVANGNDDVEERESDGDMYLTSSDLEIVDDSEYFGDQSVGLRFQNIGVPQNATIEAAYLEFVVEAINNGQTDVQIRGESADNAPPFTTADSNLSNRTTTNTVVNWSIPAWETKGVQVQSPELKTVVQEIVNRPNWAAYNNMVFVLTGSGERAAESYEGASSLAPLLHIEYTTGEDPVPTVTPTPLPTTVPTATPTPPPATAQIVVGDYHVSAGGRITVSLDVIDVSPPGIGSANIDVAFDSTVLSVVSCSADPNTIFDIRLCNPSSDKVTFGVTANTGTLGDVVLGEIVFDAIGALGSSSPLTLNVTTFADTGSNSLAHTLDDGNAVISLAGDVNCSGARDLIDAQQIMQYAVDLRAAHNSCTLPADTIYLPLCDVNVDHVCDVFDAFLIAQCAIGIDNSLCPSTHTRAVQPPSDVPTTIGVETQQITVGETATFPVSAVVPTMDNLSAATIAIYYDPTLVSATDCQIDGSLIGACNPAYDNDGFAPDVLLFSVIAPMGATGAFDLADITLRGEAVGNGTLTIDVRSLRNADGEDLLVTTQDGSTQVTQVPLSVGLVGSWVGFGRYWLPLAILVGVILTTAALYRNDS